MKVTVDDVKRAGKVAMKAGNEIAKEGGRAVRGVKRFAEAEAAFGQETTRAFLESGELDENGLAKSVMQAVTGKDDEMEIG